MDRLSEWRRFAKVDACTLAHNRLPIDSLLDGDGGIDVIEGDDNTTERF